MRIVERHNNHDRYIDVKRTREARDAAFWKLQLNKIVRCYNIMPPEFMPEKKERLAAETIH
jgi:hypothetical protein